ncbi:hypothetical protein TB1_010010 [Malus domestica]
MWPLILEQLPLCPISFVVDLRRLLLYSVTVAASSFRQTASSSSYSLADTDTNVFTPPSLSDSLSPQPSPPPSPPFSSPPPPSSLPSPPPSRASPPPLSSYKERFITKGSMRLRYIDIHRYIDIEDASTVLEVENVVGGFSAAGHNRQQVKLGRRTGARTPPSLTHDRPGHIVSPAAPQKTSVKLLPHPPPPRRMPSTSSTPC